MSSSGIYAIAHLANGKLYVGSSSDIRQRWYQHRYFLRAGTHHNKKLQNAWSKYGEEAFCFTVLELVQVGTQLVEREQFYLDRLDVVRSGFNVCWRAGRERAGTSHTKEAIARMSESHKGKVISPEHRAKLSDAFRGRVFSDEHRARISAAKRGKKRPPVSDETRAKLSAALKGRSHSPETRAKLSAAHLARLGRLI